MSHRSPSKSNLSECSSDQDISQEEFHIKKFAKHMLRGKIFVGTYFEKRYVDEINGYRDIVLINSNETELIKDLSVVIKRIRGFYRSQWIGITTSETIGAPVGYCLWVELEQEVFGSYWYKIKSVRFRDKEIILQLRQVRPIEEVKQAVQNSETELNLQKNQEDIQEIFWKKIREFSLAVSDVMTPHNIKETIIFLSILIITLFTGMIQLLQYLLDFSLKLMREASFLMRSVTPFAISVVHMFEKIVGGFYILLAMVWRDFRSPANTYNPVPNNMITYHSNRQRGAFIQEIQN